MRRLGWRRSTAARRSLRACVVFLTIGCGCTQILKPLRMDPSDADGDGGNDDGGSDDGGSDADRHVDGGPDADSTDGEGDLESDAAQGVIEDVTAEALVDGPYPAATSVLVRLVASWDGGRAQGALVVVSTQGGGLVSTPPEAAHRTSLRLRTDADGELPTIRVTFPLEPWPYATSLFWRLSNETDTKPMTGESELHVVEPELTDLPIVGSTDEIMTLPRGLVPSLYAEIGDEFDYGIYGGNCDINSLTFAWDDTSSTMVVSSDGETCFFDDALAAECHQTRPSALWGTGPDDLQEVAFYDSDDSARGLYAVAYAGDGTSPGGLYSLGSDGSTERIDLRTNVRALEPVPGRNSFMPSDGAGIYFFGQGELRFWDPVGETEATRCEDFHFYPTGIALGDVAVYGGRYLFLVREQSDDSTAWVERLESTCVGGPVLDLDYWDPHEPHAESSPGMVFGRTVYVTAGNTLLLLLPSTSGAVEGFEVIPYHENLAIHEPAFMPVVEGTAVHPPGLYLLDHDFYDARIIRIAQDLSG